MKVVCLIIFAISIFANYNSTEASSTTWTKSTIAKFDNLVSLGMPAGYARSLITICKKRARDPAHCIKYHAVITGAESSMANNCISHNCTGLGDGSIRFKSDYQAIWVWVRRYNKYWYKAKSPSYFYRDDGIPPKSHYCMGPKGDGVCKNGTKNAWETFNSLTF